jgi:hypothetical protein
MLPLFLIYINRVPPPLSEEPIDGVTEKVGIRYVRKFLNERFHDYNLDVIL